MTNHIVVMHYLYLLNVLSLKKILDWFRKVVWVNSRLDNSANNLLISPNSVSRGCSECSDNFGMYLFMDTY